MNQFRLLAMTVLLTVLIWASADRLVTEAGPIGVTFRAVPATNMLVQLNPQVERFEVLLSGSRRVLEAVQAHGVYSLALPIDDRPTGPATLVLDRRWLKRELAAAWPEFQKLTVVSVQPETMDITVDRMTQVDAQVTARRLTLAYEAEPQLSRTNVTVRLRETSLANLSAEQPWVVEIGPELERLLREQPVGKKVTVGVLIDPRRFAPEAEVSPASVDVTATVRAQRLTERIPTVPVLVAMSFATLNQSVIAADADGVPLTLVTQSILVTGLAEDVQRLVRGETRAFGLIQIREDDLRTIGVTRLAVPEYHLPKGVELAEDPGKIEFQFISDANALRRN